MVDGPCTLVWKPRGLFSARHVLCLHNKWFSRIGQRSVFRTQRLNVFFLYVLSFWVGITRCTLGESSEHHKYTLHPPEDGEVVLPVYLTLKGFLRGAFVDPLGAYHRIRSTVMRGFFGHLNPGWDQVLFPPENVEGRRRLVRWDKVMTLGHVLLLVGSLYMGWWQLPVLVTLGSRRFLFAVRNTQHIGLSDNVADFPWHAHDLLNPIVRFLYWHMNFHIEHHMYAAVPCYRLGRLHKAIEHDLPPSPVGLVATWREIVGILKRQKEDPSYQHIPPLPEAAAAG